jgi:hypothetical protein
LQHSPQVEPQSKCTRSPRIKTINKRRSPLKPLVYLQSPSNATPTAPQVLKLVHVRYDHNALNTTINRLNNPSLTILLHHSLNLRLSSLNYRTPMTAIVRASRLRYHNLLSFAPPPSIPWKNTSASQKKTFRKRSPSISDSVVSPKKTQLCDAGVQHLISEQIIILENGCYKTT